MNFQRPSLGQLKSRALRRSESSSWPPFDAQDKLRAASRFACPSNMNEFGFSLPRERRTYRAGFESTNFESLDLKPKIVRVNRRRRRWTRNKSSKRKQRAVSHLTSRSWASSATGRSPARPTAPKPSQSHHFEPSALPGRSRTVRFVGNRGEDSIRIAKLGGRLEHFGMVQQ